MSLTRSRTQARVDRLAAPWVPITLVWTAGLLWLSNVSWKVPPDFGDTDGRCSGLCRFVDAGIEHPVVPGSRWVLDTIVQPQLALFGWLTLLVEATLAALLISRCYLRTAAVLGIAQSLAIGLTVANAPDEWYWAYLLMIPLHLAVLGHATVLRPTRVRTMATIVGLYGVVVAIAHAEAGFTGDRNDTWTLFTGGNDIPDELGRGTFPGSIALGLLLAVLAITTWRLTDADRRVRTTSGWALIALAAILLLTYDTSGLAIGLGSRAATAALLAALGLSLTAPRPLPDQRTSPGSP
jgi:hypothetical protein